MCKAVKREGEWKTWSFQQFYRDVQVAAKSFFWVSGLTSQITLRDIDQTM